MLEPTISLSPAILCLLIKLFSSQLKDMCFDMVTMIKNRTVCFLTFCFLKRNYSQYKEKFLGVAGKEAQTMKGKSVFCIIKKYFERSCFRISFSFLSQIFLSLKPISINSTIQCSSVIFSFFQKTPFCIPTKHPGYAFD